MSKHKSFVIYGRAGTGKTTLSSTFPGPVLLLDISDHGTDSVSDTDLDVLDVTSIDAVMETYWYLKKSKKNKYKTVILDTVSQLQMLMIKEHLESKGKPTDRIGDWGTMTKKDWGDVAAKMKTLITDFRDLPMNVVFIAQDRVFNVEDEDNAEGEIDPEIGPRLSPSVAVHINASVSIIGNTFVRRKVSTKKVGGKKKQIKTTEYCLRIGPNPVYITKIRKPKSITPPSVLIDPSYKSIVKLLKGAK